MVWKRITKAALYYHQRAVHTSSWIRQLLQVLCKQNNNEGDTASFTVHHFLKTSMYCTGANDIYCKQYTRYVHDKLLMQVSQKHKTVVSHCPLRMGIKYLLFRLPWADCCCYIPALKNSLSDWKHWLLMIWWNEKDWRTVVLIKRLTMKTSVE